MQLENSVEILGSCFDFNPASIVPLSKKPFGSDPNKPGAQKNGKTKMYWYTFFFLKSEELGWWIFMICQLLLFIVCLYNMWVGVEIAIVVGYF